MRSVVRNLVRKGLGENLFTSFRGFYWSVKLRFVAYEVETRALKFLIPRGGVSVDVGANFGQFASFLSRAAGPEGRVYCLEPLPYNREVFAAVMRGLRRSNVESFPYAVGSELATAHMSVPGLNTAEAQLTDSERCPAVEMVTLDHWAERIGLSRVDFLKVDVEGYEFFVLQGARRVLANYCPVILCEITEASTRYGHAPHEVFELMRGLGYGSHVWIERKLVPSRGPRDGIRNYFFIHASQCARLGDLLLQ
jgi:FkbM family methyltransferase